MCSELITIKNDLVRTLNLELNVPKLRFYEIIMKFVSRKQYGVKKTEALEKSQATLKLRIFFLNSYHEQQKHVFVEHCTFVLQYFIY